MFVVYTCTSLLSIHNSPPNMLHKLKDTRVVLKDSSCTQPDFNYKPERSRNKCLVVCNRFEWMMWDSDIRVQSRHVHVPWGRYLGWIWTGLPFIVTTCAFDWLRVSANGSILACTSHDCWDNRVIRVWIIITTVDLHWDHGMTPFT